MAERVPLSPLATPSATRAVLEAHGLATKHALGQHFLVSDDVVRKTVALSEVGAKDVVLEVGPGIGTLTVALLKTARAVVSVERDHDLPAVLAQTCAPWADRFALIEKDALELTVGDVALACARIGCPPPNAFVANLPYAVAATVVLDYFERFSQIERATVMVQKEVADRMAARPETKDYGAYTVKLALRARVAGRFAVGSGSFFPPPHVDSAVVRLDRSAPADAAGSPVDEATVGAAALMAEAAFATRRKTIANSCRTFFAGRGEAGARVAAALPDVFAAAGIDPRRRGEGLASEEFVALGRAALPLLAEGRAAKDGASVGGCQQNAPVSPRFDG